MRPSRSSIAGNCRTRRLRAAAVPTILGEGGFAAFLSEPRRSPQKKPAPNYEAAPAKSADGKPATGRLCQAGLRTSGASVRRTRPATTDYRSKTSREFKKSCRVGISLRCEAARNRGPAKFCSIRRLAAGGSRIELAVPVARDCFAATLAAVGRPAMAPRWARCPALR